MRFGFGGDLGNLRGDGVHLVIGLHIRDGAFAGGLVDVLDQDNFDGDGACVLELLELGVVEVVSDVDRVIWIPALAQRSIIPSCPRL